MSLVQALERRARDSVVLVGHEGQRSAGDLLGLAWSGQSKLAGVKLAIQLADPIDGASSLVAASGSAKSLALLPPALSEADTASLLLRSGSDVLLSDGHSLGTPPAGVSVWPSLHAMPAKFGSDVHSEFDTTWLLATSGTTNTPKLVAHTLESLCRTVRKGETAAAARWGLLYDFSRFAGLQVVLQAIFGGSTLIIPPQNATLRDRLEFLREHACTHLSATPTLWRAIVMTPGCRDLPLRQITLGGEIADARILSTLKNVYPNARITHIYASTEAGVGFSVKDGQPGFPSGYLEHPPAGLALRVVDGRLHIRNTTVKPVYVGTGDQFGSEDGWIDTGDVVDVVGDRIYFRGRASGVINVGGNKVHPEEVERVLLEHPAIQAAKVYGKSSSIMGTLVAAEIVLQEPSAEPAILRSEIKAYLQNKLASYKVPAVLKIVDDLEVTSTGKLARGASAS